MEQLNSIKQPAPNIVSNSTNSKPETTKETIEPKRIIIRPNVGVVDVPTISKTPISDLLEIKKQENPRTVYRLDDNKEKPPNLYNIASIVISASALYGLLNLSKSIKKFLKS